MTESDPLLKNVRAVAELERKTTQNLSALDRFSRRFTAIAGSRAFVIGHAIWFVVWIFLLNRGPRAFDAYPFSLLNLCVSLEAVFLTSFVLMAQDKMTKVAERRAHIDLQVNLLAEQELTAILQMVYALCQNAGTCARVNDPRVKTLLEETDIVRLAVAIDQELDKDAGTQR